MRWNAPTIVAIILFCCPHPHWRAFASTTAVPTNVWHQQLDTENNVEVRSDLGNKPPLVYPQNRNREPPPPSLPSSIQPQAYNYHQPLSTNPQQLNSVPDESQNAQLGFNQQVVTSQPFQTPQNFAANKNTTNGSGIFSIFPVFSPLHEEIIRKESVETVPQPISVPLRNNIFDPVNPQFTSHSWSNGMYPIHDQVGANNAQPSSLIFPWNRNNKFSVPFSNNLLSFNYETGRDGKQPEELITGINNGRSLNTFNGEERAFFPGQIQNNYYSGGVLGPPSSLPRPINNTAINILPQHPINSFQTQDKLSDGGTQHDIIPSIPPLLFNSFQGQRNFNVPQKLNEQNHDGYNGLRNVMSHRTLQTPLLPVSIPLSQPIENGGVFIPSEDLSYLAPIIKVYSDYFGSTNRSGGPLSPTTNLFPRENGEMSARKVLDIALTNSVQNNQFWQTRESSPKSQGQTLTIPQRDDQFSDHGPTKTANKTGLQTSTLPEIKDKPPPNNINAASSFLGIPLMPKNDHFRSHPLNQIPVFGHSYETVDDSTNGPVPIDVDGLIPADIRPFVISTTRKYLNNQLGIPPIVRPVVVSVGEFPNLETHSPPSIESKSPSHFVSPKESNDEPHRNDYKIKSSIRDSENPVPTDQRGPDFQYILPIFTNVGNIPSNLGRSPQAGTTLFEIPEYLSLFPPARPRDGSKGVMDRGSQFYIPFNEHPRSPNAFQKPPDVPTWKATVSQNPSQESTDPLKNSQYIKRVVDLPNNNSPNYYGSALSTNFKTDSESGAHLDSPNFFTRDHQTNKPGDHNITNSATNSTSLEQSEFRRDQDVIFQYGTVNQNHNIMKGDDVRSSSKYVLKEKPQGYEMNLEKKGSLNNESSDGVSSQSQYYPAEELGLNSDTTSGSRYTRINNEEVKHSSDTVSDVIFNSNEGKGTIEVPSIYEYIREQIKNKITFELNSKFNNIKSSEAFSHSPTTKSAIKLDEHIKKSFTDEYDNNPSSQLEQDNYNKPSNNNTSYTIYPGNKNLLDNGAHIVTSGQRFVDINSNSKTFDNGEDETNNDTLWSSNKLRHEQYMPGKSVADASTTYPQRTFQKLNTLVSSGRLEESQNAPSLYEQDGESSNEKLARVGHQVPGSPSKIGADVYQKITHLSAEDDSDTSRIVVHNDKESNYAIEQHILEKPEGNTTKNQKQYKVKVVFPKYYTIDDRSRISQTVLDEKTGEQIGESIQVSMKPHPYDKSQPIVQNSTVHYHESILQSPNTHNVNDESRSIGDSDATTIYEGTRRSPFTIARDEDDEAKPIEYEHEELNKDWNTASKTSAGVPTNQPGPQEKMFPISNAKSLKSSIATDSVYKELEWDDETVNNEQYKPKSQLITRNRQPASAELYQEKDNAQLAEGTFPTMPREMYSRLNIGATSQNILNQDHYTTQRYEKDVYDEDQRQSTFNGALLTESSIIGKDDNILGHLSTTKHPFTGQQGLHGETDEGNIAATKSRLQTNDELTISSITSSVVPANTRTAPYVESGAHPTPSNPIFSSSSSFHQLDENGMNSDTVYQNVTDINNIGQGLGEVTRNQNLPFILLGKASTDNHGPVKSTYNKDLSQPLILESSSIISSDRNDSLPETVDNEFKIASLDGNLVFHTGRTTHKLLPTDNRKPYQMERDSGDHGHSSYDGNSQIVDSAVASEQDDESRLGHISSMTQPYSGQRDLYEDINKEVNIGSGPLKQVSSSSRVPTSGIKISNAENSSWKRPDDSKTNSDSDTVYQSVTEKIRIESREFKEKQNQPSIIPRGSSANKDGRVNSKYNINSLTQTETGPKQPNNRDSSSDSVINKQFAGTVDHEFEEGAITSKKLNQYKVNVKFMSGDTNLWDSQLHQEKINLGNMNEGDATTGPDRKIPNGKNPDSDRLLGTQDLKYQQPIHITLTEIPMNQSDKPRANHEINGVFHKPGINHNKLKHSNQTVYYYKDNAKIQLGMDVYDEDQKHSLHFADSLQTESPELVVEQDDKVIGHLSSKIHPYAGQIYLGEEIDKGSNIGSESPITHPYSGQRDLGEGVEKGSNIGSKSLIIHQYSGQRELGEEIDKGSNIGSESPITNPNSGQRDLVEEIDKGSKVGTESPIIYSYSGQRDLGEEINQGSNIGSKSPIKTSNKGIISSSEQSRSPAYVGTAPKNFGSGALPLPSNPIFSSSSTTFEQPDANGMNKDLGEFGETNRTPSPRKSSISQTQEESGPKQPYNKSLFSIFGSGKNHLFSDTAQNVFEEGVRGTTSRDQHTVNVKSASGFSDWGKSKISQKETNQENMNGANELSSIIPNRNYASRNGQMSVQDSTYEQPLTTVKQNVYKNIEDTTKQYKIGGHDKDQRHSSFYGNLQTVSSEGTREQNSKVDITSSHSGHRGLNENMNRSTYTEIESPTQIGNKLKILLVTPSAKPINVYEEDPRDCHQENKKMLVEIRDQRLTVDMNWPLPTTAQVANNEHSDSNIQDSKYRSRIKEHKVDQPHQYDTYLQEDFEERNVSGKELSIYSSTTNKDSNMMDNAEQSMHREQFMKMQAISGNASNTKQHNEKHETIDNLELNEQPSKERYATNPYSTLSLGDGNSKPPSMLDTDGSDKTIPRTTSPESKTQITSQDYNYLSGIPYRTSSLEMLNSDMTDQHRTSSSSSPILGNQKISYKTSQLPDSHTTTRTAQNDVKWEATQYTPVIYDEAKDVENMGLLIADDYDRFTDGGTRLKNVFGKPVTSKIDFNVKYDAEPSIRKITLASSTAPIIGGIISQLPTVDSKLKENHPSVYHGHYDPLSKLRAPLYGSTNDQQKLDILPGITNRANNRGTTTTPYSKELNQNNLQQYSLTFGEKSNEGIRKQGVVEGPTIDVDEKLTIFETSRTAPEENFNLLVQGKGEDPTLIVRINTTMADPMFDENYESKLPTLPLSSKLGTSTKQQRVDERTTQDLYMNNEKKTTDLYQTLNNGQRMIQQQAQQSTTAQEQAQNSGQRLVESGMGTTELGGQAQQQQHTESSLVHFYYASEDSSDPDGDPFNYLEIPYAGPTYFKHPSKPSTSYSEQTPQSVTLSGHKATSEYGEINGQKKPGSVQVKATFESPDDETQFYPHFPSSNDATVPTAHRLQTGESARPNCVSFEGTRNNQHDDDPRRLSSDPYSNAPKRLPQSPGTRVDTTQDRVTPIIEDSTLAPTIFESIYQPIDIGQRGGLVNTKQTSITKGQIPSLHVEESPNKLYASRTSINMEGRQIRKPPIFQQPVASKDKISSKDELDNVKTVKEFTHSQSSLRNKMDDDQKMEPTSLPDFIRQHPKEIDFSSSKSTTDPEYTTILITQRGNIKSDVATDLYNEGISTPISQFSSSQTLPDKYNDTRDKSKSSYSASRKIVGSESNYAESTQERENNEASLQVRWERLRGSIEPGESLNHENPRSDSLQDVQDPSANSAVTLSPLLDLLRALEFHELQDYNGSSLEDYSTVNATKVSELNSERLTGLGNSEATENRQFIKDPTSFAVAGSKPLTQLNQESTTNSLNQTHLYIRQNILAPKLPDHGVTDSSYHGDFQDKFSLRVNKDLNASKTGITLSSTSREQGALENNMQNNSNGIIMTQTGRRLMPNSQELFDLESNLNSSANPHVPSSESHSIVNEGGSPSDKNLDLDPYQTNVSRSVPNNHHATSEVESHLSQTTAIVLSSTSTLQPEISTNVLQLNDKLQGPQNSRANVYSGQRILVDETEGTSNLPSSILQPKNAITPLEQNDKTQSHSTSKTRPYLEQHTLEQGTEQFVHTSIGGMDKGCKSKAITEQLVVAPIVGEPEKEINYLPTESSFSTSKTQIPLDQLGSNGKGNVQVNSKVAMYVKNRNSKEDEDKRVNSVTSSANTLQHQSYTNLSEFKGSESDKLDSKSRMYSGQRTSRNDVSKKNDSSIRDEDKPGAIAVEPSSSGQVTQRECEIESRGNDHLLDNVKDSSLKIYGYLDRKTQEEEENVKSSQQTETYSQNSSSKTQVFSDTMTVRKKTGDEPGIRVESSITNNNNLDQQSTTSGKISASSIELLNGISERVPGNNSNHVLEHGSKVLEDQSLKLEANSDPKTRGEEANEGYNLQTKATNRNKDTLEEQSVTTGKSQSEETSQILPSSLDVLQYKSSIDVIERNIETYSEQQAMGKQREEGNDELVKLSSLMNGHLDRQFVTLGKPLASTTESKGKLDSLKRADSNLASIPMSGLPYRSSIDIPEQQDRVYHQEPASRTKVFSGERNMEQETVERPDQHIDISGLDDNNRSSRQSSNTEKTSVKISDGKLESGPIRGVQSMASSLDIPQLQSAIEIITEQQNNRPKDPSSKAQSFSDQRTQSDNIGDGSDLRIKSHSLNDKLDMQSEIFNKPSAGAIETNGKSGGRREGEIEVASNPMNMVPSGSSANLREGSGLSIKLISLDNEKLDLQSAITGKPSASNIEPSDKSVGSIGGASKLASNLKSAIVTKSSIDILEPNNLIYRDPSSRTQGYSGQRTLGENTGEESNLRLESSDRDNDKSDQKSASTGEVSASNIIPVSKKRIEPINESIKARVPVFSPSRTPKAQITIDIPDNNSQLLKDPPSKPPTYSGQRILGMKTGEDISQSESASINKVELEQGSGTASGSSMDGRTAVLTTDQTVKSRKPSASNIEYEGDSELRPGNTNIEDSLGSPSAIQTEKFMDMFGKSVRIVVSDPSSKTSALPTSIRGDDTKPSNMSPTQNEDASGKSPNNGTTPVGGGAAYLPFTSPNINKLYSSPVTTEEDKDTLEYQHALRTLRNINSGNFKLFSAEYFIQLIQRCNCDSLKFLIPILQKNNSRILVTS